MHAPIIQFITQCLNSEVKLRWNHETEREKVHSRELQSANGCCLLRQLPVAPAARGGRAKGHGCRPMRGCGMLTEQAAEVVLGRSRTGRRQPAGSASPPRGQRRPAPVGAAGVEGGGRRRARAAAGGSAVRPHARAQGWSRGGTGGVPRARVPSSRQRRGHCPMYLVGGNQQASRVA